LAFARAAGVEPGLGNWPELRRALLFGPLAPNCFRLEGPDALPDAGAISDGRFTERERRYLLMLGRENRHQRNPIDQTP
jgi:hypothetical protein